MARLQAGAEPPGAKLDKFLKSANPYKSCPKSLVNLLFPSLTIESLKCISPFWPDSNNPSRQIALNLSIVYTHSQHRPFEISYNRLSNCPPTIQESKIRSGLIV